MNCCSNHAYLVERVIVAGQLLLEAIEAEEEAVEEEERRRKEENRRRRPWVRDWVARRSILGGEVLMEELALEDPCCFTNVMRMSPEKFDDLLEMVKNSIQKEDTIMRPALPARLKLQITLRYLASGDSLKSLSLLFRVSPQSISSFLPEVLHAIVDALSNSLRFPETEDQWLKIAGLFSRKWNFPRCTGAIDGKHIHIKQPPRSGSKFFNYKGTYSVVLFAMVDADYNFTYVNVGTNGRENDAAIFNDSKLREVLDRKSFNFPNNHVILGDSIFPLKEHLMIPYSRRSSNIRHCVFNYCLSRARRIVENAFGILAWRFRVFMRPIEMKESTVDYIVLAACYLHNWLRSFSPSYITTSCVDREDANTGELIHGQWRHEIEPLQSARKVRGCNNYKQSAENVRKAYAKYFCEDGAIESQWKATGLSPEDYDTVSIEESATCSSTCSTSDEE